VKLLTIAVSTFLACFVDIGEIDVHRCLNFPWMINNFTNIKKTNKESLNSDGHQFHQYQQNKESLNSNGQQFHQYQQNGQSPLTRCDVRIHVLVWDRHNNVAGLFLAFRKKMHVKSTPICCISGIKHRRDLEMKLTRGKGDNPLISLALPHYCVCPKQGRLHFDGDCLRQGRLLVSKCFPS
jgi:hypothetical protein